MGLSKFTPSPSIHLVTDMTWQLSRIMKTLKQAQISLKSGGDAPHLPSTLEVQMSDLTSDLPTHVLAVFPRLAPSGSTAKPKVSLHLTHSIILGTHCASIPVAQLARKASQTVSETTTYTLPVIPVVLPDPNRFSVLHFFLYTHSALGLLSSLLPLPPNLTQSQSQTTSSPTPSLDIPTISAHLARTYTPTILGEIAAHIHGVWANACSLGVWEESLWDTIDLCWAAVIGAYKLIALHQAPSEPTKL